MQSAFILTVLSFKDDGIRRSDKTLGSSGEEEYTVTESIRDGKAKVRHDEWSKKTGKENEELSPHHSMTCEVG